MRYIKFDEYYEKNKIEFMKKRLLLREKRLRKSRKKSKEEWDILHRISKERFKKSLESKELEKIGLRRWRLKI